MDHEPGAFRLRIPASADRSAMVRLFVAAAARQMGADEAVVDDLRLAVTEACTLAMRTARTPLTMEVVIGAVPDAIRITMGTVADAEPPAGGSTAEELEPDGGSGLALLETIVSELQVATDADGQVAISFTLRWVPLQVPGAADLAGTEALGSLGDAAASP